MAGLSIEQGAAASRLASGLAIVLTNPSITAAARTFDLPAEGSNKPARLTSLILASFELSAFRQEQLLASLVLEAYRLHTAGRVSLSEDAVEAIVTDIRAMGVDPGTLASKKWRVGLASSRASGPPPPSARPAPVGTASRHEAQLARLSRLLGDAVAPQARGRELEDIVFQTAQVEGLLPEKNISLPGEEIDVSLVVNGSHYLVECKWEASPVGFPVVEAFMARVRSKAEGAFGVVLSMSGFVGDINSKAPRGARLNCVGLSHASLMAVLEGRATWAGLLATARRAASTRSVFLAPGL